MSRMLGLNETQEGVLAIIFKIETVSLSIYFGNKLAEPIPVAAV